MSTMTQMNAQTDNRWRGQLLGYNTAANNNIGNLGCLITAWSNMLWWITGDSGYTPPLVNGWMKDNHGFLEGTGTFIWGTALGMGHVTAQGQASSVNAVNNWLAANENNYAILQVTKAGFPMHFVMAPLVGQIIDSEDGKLKSMGSYSFVNAHLYTAIVAAPAPATHVDAVTAAPAAPANAINEDTAPMTADQETQAYQIVLGRNPEHAVPDGRTAMQFILDAQAEASDNRAASNNKIDSLSAQVSQLTGENQSLNDQVTQLKAAGITSAKALFEDTYKPLGQAVSMTATQSGYATDYSGTKAAVAVSVGTQFTGDSAIAGTFSIDGQQMYRTKKSVANGDWFGIPQSLFATTSLTATQNAHLVAAETAGVVSRAWSNVTSVFKKGSK